MIRNDTITRLSCFLMFVSLCYATDLRSLLMAQFSSPFDVKPGGLTVFDLNPLTASLSRTPTQLNRAQFTYPTKTIMSTSPPDNGTVTQPPQSIPTTPSIPISGGGISPLPSPNGSAGSSGPVSSTPALGEGKQPTTPAFSIKFYFPSGAILRAMIAPKIVQMSPTTTTIGGDLTSLTPRTDLITPFSPEKYKALFSQ